MMFADRADAGRQLSEHLRRYRTEDVVVLGLPRGGVPVAAEVAAALHAPLDVIVVRKLGVPSQPELAMGAIGEGSVRVLNENVIRLARVSTEELAAVEARERRELERRVQRLRAGTRRGDVNGRIALVVDDGIATGSTARAACQVARAHGAAKVVLAAPVAPADAAERFHGDADELVVPTRPEPFYGVGQFYEDFSPVSDDEVVDILARAARSHAAGRGSPSSPAPHDGPRTSRSARWRSSDISTSPNDRSG